MHDVISCNRVRAITNKHEREHRRNTIYFLTSYCADTHRVSMTHKRISAAHHRRRRIMPPGELSIGQSSAPHRIASHRKRGWRMSSVWRRPRSGHHHHRRRCRTQIARAAIRVRSDELRHLRPLRQRLLLYSKLKTHAEGWWLSEEIKRKYITRFDQFGSQPTGSERPRIDSIFAIVTQFGSSMYC